MFWRRSAALVSLFTAGAAIVTAGASASPVNLASLGTAGSPPGFQPQSLTRAGGTREVVVAGTAPCGRLYCAVVLSGSPGADGLVRDWRQLRPPPVPPAHDAVSLNVGMLAFANSLDGYDLVLPSTVGGAARVYATTDAGASWRQVSLASGTVLTLVAAPSGFYAVTARCRPESCDDYRLARSPAGATRWSSTPIPGTARLDGNPVGLAVQGGEVLLNFLPLAEGAEPHLLVAADGRGPFRTHVVPQLVSVQDCDLTLEPGGAVWASCPTGMLVSYWHSPSVAGPYSGVWDYAGTGGGGLVPVTGSIAYRYTGIPVSSTEKLPGDVLQRSVDDGRTFTDVGPWPFARNVGTTPRFLFLDEQDGFGLGSVPTNPTTAEVVETTDGGRHWAQVLP